MQSSTSATDADLCYTNQWQMLDVALQTRVAPGHGHEVISLDDKKTLRQCCVQLHDSVEQQRALAQSNRQQANDRFLSHFRHWFRTQRIQETRMMSKSLDLIAGNNMLIPNTIRNLQQCCKTLHDSPDLQLKMDEAAHLRDAASEAWERELADREHDYYPGQWITFDEARAWTPTSSSGSSSSCSRSNIRRF